MDTKVLSALTKEPESRTTCTLSTEGIVALDCLTKEFGLTQKQVVSYFFTNDEIDKGLMDMILELNKFPVLRQTRKSLVLTKKNLKLLNNTSKETKLQRDTIIDFGFKYLAMIFKAAESQQKKQYEQCINMLNDLLSSIERIEQDLQSNLGEDDAVVRRISTLFIITSNLIDEINNNIQNGVKINPEGI